jgi:hypothetical protein
MNLGYHQNLSIPIKKKKIKKKKKIGVAEASELLNRSRTEQIEILA